MVRHESRRRGQVALVGRPNVGKSTLFNRLTRSRHAIVTSVPGTTRDLLEGTVEWQGCLFTLFDTGGVIGRSEDPMRDSVAERMRKIAGAVDVLVLVVDGREGVLPADDELAQELRTRGVPVVVAVNKTDDHRARDRVAEFHRFGYTPVLEIAAEHGLGLGELLEEVVSLLPEADSAGRQVEDRSDTAQETRMAIVGRPNVGKSSLLNRLLGEERALVDSLPGTTRDTVEDVLRWHRRKFRVIDTAGIRRPGRVAKSGKLEVVSVVRARHAMAKADVAVLVVDASQGVGRRDASIAGEVEAAGCSVVITANKWDLVKDKGPEFVKEFDRQARDALKFLDYAPIVHLSALTGERIDVLLARIDEVGLARCRKIGTGELNRFLERAMGRQSPSGARRGTIKVRYAVQSGVAPPTFTMFTSKGARLHFSYERYLRKQLREAFGFIGTPIRLKVRGRE